MNPGLSPAPPQGDGGPRTAVRYRVHARDGWACVCCGTPVRGRPHSAGQRSRHGGNDPSNLLTFLGAGTDPGDPDDHYARIRSGRDLAGGVNGYRLLSWQDTAQVPVKIMSAAGPAAAVWLSGDGRYLLDPPEAAA